jgi:hypothetical protein
MVIRSSVCMIVMSQLFFEEEQLMTDDRLL